MNLKPRLRRYMGMWECSKPGYRAYDHTPDLAYARLNKLIIVTEAKRAKKQAGLLWRIGWRV